MSANFCEGCTCGRDKEALDGALRRRDGMPARSFTAPADPPEVGPKEGIEPAVPLRSKEWYNKPSDASTGGYIERYLNGGRTLAEIQRKNTPIIGIAQTGSDISPCNSHHRELAKRVRDGIIAAGGTPMEFGVHPIQETTRRPSPTIDRNLAYLDVVETLHGYPIDGVVLLTGCDKTTPALLMAAATVNIPAICMNVGPMLNGYDGAELIGSGAVAWKAREERAKGNLTHAQYLQRVALSAPRQVSAARHSLWLTPRSLGHCNTMGTASTMNAMAEALGMALPGSASIPAVYRERGACAYQTGIRAVEITMQDVKPSDILTKEAFENAIACCTAIGGSTNAPIHLNAIAKHIGVELNCDDWERVGYELPLLVNILPAGKYLCEEYHRAGGLPAVVAELMAANKLPHPDALTISGKTMGENCRGDFSNDPRVIMPYAKPLQEHAGFLNLKGSLFDSAIMKTSVISQAFREQYLNNPNDPMAFEGPVAVFDGVEQYRDEINTRPHIGAGTILIMRGAGPIGHPGAAEVVNMIPPDQLIKEGIELPCIGDGRQSGTSGSPSILNASPEAAVGGMLAYLKDGDIIRIDLKKRTADVKLTPEEIEARKKEMGPYKYPPSQTPWQEIYRENVGQLNEGMVFDKAVKYQRIAQVHPVARLNH